MGERTGLLIGFLTVNWGLKPVQGGQDTYFRVEYMFEEWVFRWIGYSWKLVLYCATVILFYYFSRIFSDSFLMEGLSHYIVLPNSFPLSTCLLSNNHLFKLINSCRVTNCNPNPKELGNKPNKPNTINL